MVGHLVSDDNPQYSGVHKPSCSPHWNSFPHPGLIERAARPGSCYSRGPRGDKVDQRASGTGHQDKGGPGQLVVPEIIFNLHFHDIKDEHETVSVI